MSTFLLLFFRPILRWALLPRYLIFRVLEDRGELSEFGIREAIRREYKQDFGFRAIHASLEAAVKRNYLDTEIPYTLSPYGRHRVYELLPRGHQFIAFYERTLKRPVERQS